MPYTICPGSSYPFYIVTYYIEWVTTSWTHSRLQSYYSKTFQHVLLCWNYIKSKKSLFSDQLHKIMEEKMSNFSIQKKEKTDEEKKLKGKIVIIK